MAPAVALVGIAIAAASASAGRLAVFEVECPVCGCSFSGRQVAWLPDADEGTDRDFLTHALGPQPFIFECWTCPKCSYSGRPRDFDSELAPTNAVSSLKSRNPLLPLSDIEEPRTVHGDPHGRADPGAIHSDLIPALVRFDLWIQVLRLDRATPPGQLAYAHMRAAQTQRFDWTSPLLRDRTACAALFERVKDGLPKAGYERDIAAARAFEDLAADTSNGLTAVERSFALAKAAQFYKMRGEDPDAARVVALARKAHARGPGVEKALREVETRVSREREYSLRAVPYLEKVLADGRGYEELRCIPKPRSDAEARAFCAYLIGVIHRKTGERRKALDVLRPLLVVDGLREGFRPWIEEQIRKVRE